MFCGLQQMTAHNKDWPTFIKCDECMMNTVDDDADCHYYFESKEVFDKYLKKTGLDHCPIKLNTLRSD